MVDYSGSTNHRNLNLLNTASQKSSTTFAHGLASGHDIINQQNFEFRYPCGEGKCVAQIAFALGC